MRMDDLHVINHRYELLDKLWDIQDRYGYIRNEDVKKLSSNLGISQIDLEGVISFYHFFKREPAGKYTIYLNNSILSEFAGFSKIKTSLERETGARFGQVDPSGTFGLFETSCIGLSNLEPSALINLRPFTLLTPQKVHRIISDLKAGKDIDEVCDKPIEQLRYTPGPDRSIFYRFYHMGAALEAMKKMGSDEIIRNVKESGLAGMGGAFFPTHIKWQACKDQPNGPKFIVANADEGEPGTFKDRVIMQAMPGLLLEGMIIAGFAVGASEGVLYLRAEYRYLYDQIMHIIDYFRARGWLGKRVCGIDGFDFDIRIQLGAGAYVCGEETALLSSMEGKRGEPTSKVYFPVEKGFNGHPTVVNNVETFCAAARIIELGSEFYLQMGTPKSPGTKLLSVAGDCEKPGIYEIEWGMTIEELMNKCGATNPYAIQLSGPAGNFINYEKNKHRKISMEDLLEHVRCGGAVTVYNKSRNLLQILRNYNRFFIHESCGICTPCRAGNYLLNRLLRRVHRGLGDQDDLKKLQDWSAIVKYNSRCGLGQTSPNSIEQSISEFPEYFKGIVKENDLLNQQFDLESAISVYEDTIKKNKLS
jgi:[NiFe] hydrogenase diaphorase moiety large subunit